MSRQVIKQMQKRSFESWLHQQTELPIYRFYADTDGTVVYALYQDREGDIHYNDIRPHAEPEKLSRQEFHRQFKLHPEGIIINQI